MGKCPMLAIAATVSLFAANIPPALAEVEVENEAAENPALASEAGSEEETIPGIDPGDTLSEQLHEDDGVIDPPPIGDSEIGVPPPNPDPNSTVVIPPPSLAPGDPTVQPK